MTGNNEDIMPKRFTETEKWDRPWFRNLPVEYKALWIYICDTCNPGGVWYVDMEKANFMIGAKIEKEKAAKTLSKQIEIIDDGSRWHVKSFIEFQYGCKPENLSPSSSVHRGAIKARRDAGLKITETQSESFSKPYERLN